MKKMLRNIVYTGLIGASALTSFGADKPKNNKDSITTYDIVKEGLPSKVGITTTKFGVGFDNKPFTYTQTPFVTIPKISDLEISSNYSPMNKSDYDNLISDKNKKDIQPTRESLADFAIHIRPNLATIISSYWSTNNAGERIQHLNGGGSGTIITPNGFLLTVNHVTEGNTNTYTALSFSKEGEVRLSPLRVIASSPKRDVALCKLEGHFPDVRPLRIRENHILPNEKVIGFNLEYGSPEKIGTEIKIKDKVKSDTINNLFPLVRQDERGNITIDSFKDKVPLIAAWIGSAGTGRFTPIDLAMRKGRINELQEEQKVTTGKTFEYTVPIYNSLSNPGNSGTATFDTSGNIMGLLSTGSYEENKGQIVSPHTLIEFITRYKTQEKN